jgi:tetratricopeptide (TPR) repeat protein
MPDSANKPVLRIFISATSGDLRSVRETVRRAIQALGCLPVEQEGFAPDYRTVAGSLREKIKGCDAVIHIVGRRYGAEPSPDSRPAGTARRSYTQLEYFMARELGKKTFVVLCGDDFPYDPCDKEDLEKIALQKNHYSRLAGADDEYRVVSTGEACYSYVLQLQVQFEELANRIARIQRNHRLLLVAVVVSLAVLIALGVMQLAWLSRQHRDTKRVVDAVGGLDQHLSHGIDGLSATVDRVATNQTAVEICKRVGADWTEIEQLYLQAKASGTGVLEYASQLHEKGRHRESIDLSRFLAECALLSDPPDHKSAARAFHSALYSEWDREDLGMDRREVVVDRLRSLEALATRGFDAATSAQALDPSFPPPIIANLLIFKARALLRLSSLQAWEDASPKSLIGMLAQLESSIVRQDLPHDIAAKLSLVEAACLKDVAATQRPPEEQQSLRKAVQCAREAYERSVDASDKAESLLVQGEMLLALADTLVDDEARDAFGKAVTACEACVMLDATPDKQGIRLRARILLAQAGMGLADDHLTERPSKDTRDRAIDDLKSVISEAGGKKLADVRHEAAIALLRFGQRDTSDDQQTALIANEQSAWWRVRDTLAWAEMATRVAGSVSTSNDAKTTMVEDALGLFDKLPLAMRDRPRESGNAAIGRAHLHYSHLMNLPEVERHFSLAKRRGAIGLYDGVCRDYPIESYRAIHTTALLCSIRIRHDAGYFTPDEFAAIYEKFTNDLPGGTADTPQAQFDAFFADRFREMGDYHRAVECYDRALPVYTKQEWPERHDRITERRDECSRKIAAER